MRHHNTRLVNRLNQLVKTLKAAAIACNYRVGWEYVRGDKWLLMRIACRLWHENEDINEYGAIRRKSP